MRLDEFALPEDSDGFSGDDIKRIKDVIAAGPGAWSEAMSVDDAIAAMEAAVHGTAVEKGNEDASLS